jgi:hypothetical protein
MFGKGKINISIARTNYLPGDTISGDVALTINKPVKAREVSISLIGEQTVTRNRSTGSGQRTTTTERINIYTFKQKLDNEREYSQGQNYRFDIKIPADIVGMKPLLEPNSMAGQLLDAAQTAAAMMGAISLQRTRWYLLAKLDIPGGLDISDKADITIG